MERFWALFSNFVAIVLIIKFLSPVEQGFFTTFRNLVAVKIIFELGLSYAAVQMTSHEMAHLNLNGKLLEGSEKHLKRLASLLHLMVKWYVAASIGYGLLLTPVGVHLFAGGSTTIPTSEWRAPWVLTIITVGGIIILSPLLAMMEGVGLVAEVAFFRFTTNFIGAWLVWILLATGFKLYAVPALLLPELALGIFYVLVYRRRLFGQLWKAHDRSEVMGWKDEILPFQWRIAVSWTAGYLQYQIFGPIIFDYRGAVEAGQMGLSLSIMAAISAIAIAWVQTKGPTMGRLIASKDFKALNRVFFPAFVQVIFVSSFIALMLDVCVWLLNFIHSPYAGRLLPLAPFSLLSLGVVFNAMITCLAIYLRSHKEEPYLWISVAMAIALTTIAVTMAKYYNASAVAVCYCFCMGFFLIPAYWIFQKKRREWHGELA